MNDASKAGLHPDAVQLDLLRAGLLDDMPAERSSLLHHIAECDVCRLRMARWKRIMLVNSCARSTLDASSVPAATSPAPSDPGRLMA